MADVKFSQIALSNSPPQLTDTVVGVGGGSTDRQYTLQQIQTAIGIPSPTITGPQVSAVTGEIYVNNFYPSVDVHGNPFTSVPYVTVAKSTTNPLSNFFSTLAAAQAVYPFAVALTDEVDWCAWMAALLHAANIPNTFNLGPATIVGTGWYVVNRTIKNNLASSKMVGRGTSTLLGGTSLKYNGPPGTVDAPIPILYLATVDTLGRNLTQPGASGPSGEPEGGTWTVQYINFQGLGGNMLGLVGNESSYISGIVTAAALSLFITDNGFGGTLWDGISVNGPSVFTFIQRNLFEGVYRDCVAYNACRGNFSTTMYIEDNAFSFFNRYAVCLNVNGIGAQPRVINNIFEPQGGNFFLNNPQWFVQGIPSLIVMVGTSQPTVLHNYTEVNVNVLGWLHMLGVSFGNFDLMGIDNFVSGNHLGVIQGSSCTISGTTLTYGGSIAGLLYPGMGIFGTASTQTGTLIAGSNVITGLTDTSVLRTGMGVQSIGGAPFSIAGTPTITSIDSSTQIHISNGAAVLQSTTVSLAFGIPAGTTVVSQISGTTGLAGTYTISSSLTIPSAITVGAYNETAQAVLFRLTNGYSDITDQRNVLVGSAANTFFQDNGFNTFSFLEGTATVGGIAMRSGQNTVTIGGGNCFDYAVDVPNSRIALSTCAAGQVSGSVLTVDASAQGFPFSVGQTIYGPGLANMQGPFRSKFTIQSLGTGTGGAGTYNLNADTGGTSAVQPIWAIQMTQLSDDGAYGLISILSGSFPELTSLINATTIAQPIQTQLIFGKLGDIFTPRFSIDSIRELVLFGEIFLREANIGASWNGYNGWTLNRLAFLNPLTVPAQNIGEPMFYAQSVDQFGTPVAYRESAQVFTRQFRPNGFNAAPSTGTWGVGDMVYYDTPTAGGFVGAICVGAGTPGTWKDFGAISS